MRYSVPVSKNTRTTWRVNVLEIAQALGIPVKDGQWVVIESAKDDGSSIPLSDWVDIVRWEPHQPSTYQHELAGQMGEGQ